MFKCFFAYHGPQNYSDFDWRAGYGVSSRSKLEKISLGDRVYVLQNVNNKGFEFCGIFEVCAKNHHVDSDYPYRVHLDNITKLSDFIKIDAELIGNRLPLINSGNKDWNNFQKTFCRQGASLESPLSIEVIGVLNDLLVGGFEKMVSNSFRLNRAERLMATTTWPEKPEKIILLVDVYKRNPNVVAEALFRAAGICESCGEDAPFFRKSDGSPYLEVHHKVQLASGGDDTVENAIAVCPNCHRKFHFGIE